MFDEGKFNNKKRKLSTLNVNTKDSDISIFFSPKSNTYENAIKELVDNAKEYIYIPIFYLTHKELSNQLISAKKRGVDVKIILDATAARNSYSAHRTLREEGIRIKVENFGGKMHAKSIIIDDKYIVSGSMNFTKAGNSKNDENTLIIKNKKFALQYKKYFLKLWSNIPNKYLYKDPNPESIESKNSCIDGIDNDFDKAVDGKDKMCMN
jgi:phosphatidylserine/phosphatidylglycerophosphate/cardiolipin synthase-like enzyme